MKVNYSAVTIKYSTITKFCVYILVLMHLCYFLIAFGNTSLFADSYIPKTRTLLFYIIMAIVVLSGIVYSRTKGKKFLWFEMAVLSVVWIRDLYGAVQARYAFDDTLAILRVYLYPALAVTILNLLNSKKWEFGKLLRFLLISTTIDTVARAIDSLYEHFTGTLIWENLVFGEMGYRNDIYRIQPSNLDIIIIPIAYYMYKKSDNAKEKFVCISCLLINYLYTLFIWQGRAPIIYKTIILAVLYVTRGVIMTKKKFISLFIGVLVAVIVINSPRVNALLNSFSTSDKEYGGSTMARLNAIEYYMDKYAEHPIFGTGYMNSEERIAEGGGVLGDIGMLYGLTQFGIPMIFFYILIFSRGIYIYFKLRHIDPYGGQLCIAMALLYIMFNLNIDIFYGFALSVPFYIAIVEHILHQNYDKMVGVK